MSINAQPFSPAFKLVGNLQNDQILVYDVSENAFVNATSGAGGGVAEGYTDVENTGTGISLGSDAGTTLQLKTITAGENFEIIDNGDTLVFRATFVQDHQTVQSQGTGSGLYTGLDTSSGTLKFKSISVGQGLTLSDDGQTLVISVDNLGGTPALATNNLSDLDNTDLARENLDVYSKTQVDSAFLRLDRHNLPTANNQFDLGSAERRFNDVYGETFQGTAILANNLTVTGQSGDVLTYSGGRWIAGQVTSNGPVATPNLAISGNQLSIAGGNTITLPVYQDDDNFIKLDGDSLPSVDNQFDIGSSQYRFNDIYAQTLQGVAVLANNLTIDGDAGDVLVYDNLNSKWVADGSFARKSYVDSQVAEALTSGTIDLNGYVTDAELETALANLDIPADISELTDTTGLLGQGSVDLSDYYTKSEVNTEIANIALTPGPKGDTGDQGPAGQDGAPGVAGQDGAPGVAGQDGAQGIQGEVGPVGPAGADGAPGAQGIQGETGPAGTTDYNELTNKPTIPSLDGLATQTWVIDQGFLTTDNDNQGLVLTGSTLTITGSTTSIDLSTIIPTPFSGSYDDLTDQPTIPTVPTNISDFTNDAGYITSAAVFSGSYDDLTNKPSIPVNLSDLGNVSSNTPADGQHLVFDSATSQWKPSHASAGSTNGYGDADARNAISAGTGLSYNSSMGRFALNAELGNLLDVDTSGIQNGQVLKWNGSAFVPGDDTVLTSTDQLAEGSDNLWYSDARVDNVINQKTTSDINEGVNLYFTPDRVNAILDSNIVAGTGIDIVTGTDNVKTISATVSSLDFSNITNTPTTLAGYGITDNVQGPQGEAGPQGEQGPPGADSTVAGPQGPQGIQGERGLQGEQGLQGAQGETGLQGPAGADSTVPGPQGVAGPAGADSTVPGPKGDTGDTGPQGIQGETGPAGADSTVAGPQGLQGETGPQGEQGIQGVQGEQGPAGQDGQDGASGTTDYNALTNKPTIPSDVNDLTDVDGLLGSGGGSSITSINELNDVNTTGITTGQFLEWDGTKFIAASASAADLTNESITELSDVATDTPNSGDALVWNGASWAPQAVSSGSGGSGTTAEYFKLNYSTSGALESITNTTSGVSATIVSTTGGDVEVTFSGYTFPPAGVLIYGYSRATNEYNMTPLNKDITTRKIAGGGSAGSPTAFGAMGSLTLTLKLREAESGASRSFGTPTHAWVMFTMI